MIIQNFAKFIMIAGSYLLGSVPFGLAVGKYWCRVDIRSQGSGNIGAANAFRVLGAIPGTVVLLGDAAKGAIPVLLAGKLFGHGSESAALLQVFAGLAAILGHNYSCFLGFKGGKGIATSAGVFAVISLPAFLGSLAVWILSVLITRYSSVGSLLAAIALPILLWLMKVPLSYLAFGLLASLFAFAKHIDNIRRLLQGKENKLF